MSKWWDAGAKIDEIEIKEQIGEGKTAPVFIAEDPTHQTVAVKVFSRQKMLNAEQWEKYKELFLNEGRKLSQCANRHVVKVHYVTCNKDNDKVYLVMQYLPQGSLKTMHENGPVAINIVRKIATDVTLGLQVIHNKYVLHRDIKPDNILIGEDGSYKIGDFFFAANVDKDFGVIKAHGYQRHWAPEVHETGEMDLRSEVWSACLTFYRLIHGDSLYRQSIGNEIRKDKDFVKNLKWLPHVSENWRRLLKRGLAYDPEKRFQNANELLDAINALPQDLSWECKFGIPEMLWARETPTNRIEVKWVREGAQKSWWSATNIRKETGNPRTLQKAGTPKSVAETQVELEGFFAREAERAVR